jgi:hypothetical protein
MKDNVDAAPINGYRHTINKKYTQINMVCYKQELPTYVSHLSTI